MRLLINQFDEKNMGEIILDADKIGSYIKVENDKLYRLVILIEGGLWFSWAFTTRAGRDDLYNAFLGKDNQTLQTALTKSVDRGFGFNFSAADLNNYRGL